MQKRDVNWLKYILKDEQSGYKSKIDFCTMSILIHGVHTLESLEPCCANCPVFKDLYNMSVWCSDYIFLNMVLS